MTPPLSIWLKGWVNWNWTWNYCMTHDPRWTRIEWFHSKSKYLIWISLCPHSLTAIFPLNKVRVEVMILSRDDRQWLLPVDGIESSISSSKAWLSSLYERERETGERKRDRVREGLSSVKQMCLCTDCTGRKCPQRQLHNEAVDSKATIHIVPAAK